MSTQKVNYQITGENLLSKVLRQIDSDANKTEQSINNISKGSGGGGLMGSIVGANLLTGAIQKAGSAIYDFAKGSIDAYGKQEQFLVSLKTMFHGNTQEASMLNDQLKKFATETPFELTEIQNATKMMIAYGSTSGSVVNEMRMLGDISSGVGAPLSEIGYLYGTLRTQGRAFSKDIYQFTGRGIPIVKELAKQFGVTDDKVMKLVEDGKVGFGEVEKAFKSMTSEGGQFFGMMKEQSQTLVGQTSNLSDAWDQLKAGIGKSQEGILKSTVAWATNMVNQLRRSVDVSNYVDEATKGLGKSAFGGQGIGYQANLIDDRHTKAGDITGAQRLSAFAEKIMNKTTGVAAEDVQNVKNELTQTFRDLRDEYKKGQMSTQFYASELAILNKASETLNQITKSSKATEGNLKTGASNGGANEKLGTGVTVEAHAPKNQYITINGGLVHQMTIESMDGSTPTGEIKDQISTVLVELLNDAYQAQV